jgi:hypothetical protein
MIRITQRPGPRRQWKGTVERQGHSDIEGKFRPLEAFIQIEGLCNFRIIPFGGFRFLSLFPDKRELRLTKVSLSSRINTQLPASEL